MSRSLSKERHRYNIDIIMREEKEQGSSVAPMISIIVPVYNTEQYLHRCIDSVLAQTYKDFELLLIDDGSTDSSGAICDEYAEKDGRVRVFHKQRGGEFCP